MERSKSQLLELTRAGIWNSEPNISLFEEGVDWNEVFGLARQQTLFGVVLSSVEKLPKSLHPPRELTLRVHKIVSQTRANRNLHIELLAEMLELLKSVGVERPVLLKGLGVAMNYPDSTLRACGDIDIYVGEKYYEKCFEFLSTITYIKKSSKRASGHHFNFEYKGVHIEIHKYVNAPHSAAYHRRDFVDWCREQLEGDKLRKVDIEGVEVYLPPYDLDFIFIFYHAWKHFLICGVGLRQLCDWSCYINANYKEFDYSEIERVTSYFRLKLPISIFATIAVKGLGLNSEKFPCYEPVSDSLYHSVLDKIWIGGNFGQYSPDMKRVGKNFVYRCFLGFTSAIRAMIYLLRIDASYATRFYMSNITGRAILALKRII
ncbi:MAG: nucleotidyltransferase family protein [Rikenellaceae bacterium]